MQPLPPRHLGKIMQIFIKAVLGSLQIARSISLTQIFRFCRKVSLGFSIALNIPYIFQKIHRQGSVNVSHDFKGSHYPKDVILYAAFFYVRYAVSYRDLEEIMAERGVQVDHATLNRWVVKYSPDIAKQLR